MSSGCLLTPGMAKDSTCLDDGSDYPFEVENVGESSRTSPRTPI